MWGVAGIALAKAQRDHNCNHSKLTTKWGGPTHNWKAHKLLMHFEFLWEFVCGKMLFSEYPEIGFSVLVSIILADKARMIHGTTRRLFGEPPQLINQGLFIRGWHYMVSFWKVYHVAHDAQVSTKQARWIRWRAKKHCQWARDTQEPN